MKLLSGLRRPFSYRYWNAAVYLIAANALVFLVQIATRSAELYYQMSLVPGFVMEQGQLWRLLSYMFLHSPTDFSHIVFNMLGLWIFGSELERKVGSKDFLLYYFLGGILSGLFGSLVYAATGNLYLPIIGASGAIYALMIAYAVAFPGRVLYVMGLVPVRTPVLVLGYTAIAIFSEVFSVGNAANMVHLGGFVAGGLVLFVRFGENPLRLFGRRR